MHSTTDNTNRRLEQNFTSCCWSIHNIVHGIRISITVRFVMILGCFIIFPNCFFKVHIAIIWVTYGTNQKIKEGTFIFALICNVNLALLRTVSKFDRQYIAPNDFMSMKDEYSYLLCFRKWEDKLSYHRANGTNFTLCLVPEDYVIHWKRHASSNLYWFHRF